MNIHEIAVCPSLLTDGCTTFSPRALEQLFDGRKVSHILPFNSPGATGDAANEAIRNVGRLSLSGAQPKFGLVLDEKRGLRYSAAGESSSYILKPRPTGYQLINHEFCAANENLTMQLASQVYGIDVAHNAVCFFADGQPAYLTRRFDINNGRKYAQEDFASLMGLTKENGGSDFKYCNGSYEECATVIRRYVKSYMVDLLRFFNNVLFNFISLNDDAHLKNFSLINNGREYHLSPAYDLINTSLHLIEPRIFALDKGLFKEGMDLCDTRQINYADFVEFGRRIGLPAKVVERQIERFVEPNEAADALILRSLLPADLKSRYLTGYHYRQSMIRPKS